MSEWAIRGAFLRCDARATERLSDPAEPFDPGPRERSRGGPNDIRFLVESARAIRVLRRVPSEMFTLVKAPACRRPPFSARGGDVTIFGFSGLRLLHRYLQRISTRGQAREP